MYLLLLALCVLGGCGGSGAGAEVGVTAPSVDNPTPTPSLHLFVGTYTTGTSSRGIYEASLDPSTGAISALHLVARQDDPSFLAVSPDARMLYSVGEVFSYDGIAGGPVSAYTIEAGALRLINRQPSGGAPVHVSVDATGQSVMSANYGGGSVSIHPVRGDGSLGPSSAFVQDPGTAPKAHWMGTAPNNRFVYWADLGDDTVFGSRFDAVHGTLGAVFSTSVAGGPRHLAFSPDGAFAYVLSETSNTITTLAVDAATGALTAAGTVSTLPADFQGKSFAAEIAMHPSGLFLYASNRGHDSIAVFAVRAGGGLRSLGFIPCGGKTPRSFCLDPSGTFLIVANQASDALAVFRIDGSTGLLTPVGPSISIAAPACVVSRITP